MSNAPGTPSDDLLARQLAYYDARADEYDDWFFRRGRYDRGEESTTQWFHEIEQVRTALARASWRDRSTLELAPGTGLWSQWLLEQGAQLTCVDGSAAMLAQLRRRLGTRVNDVACLQADLFSWRPAVTYDGVFFGFWLSHVPRARLADFFSLVASALAVGGRVAFVDSLRDETSTASDHVLPEGESEVMTRRLRDGREFEIVKNFYTESDLGDLARRAGIALTFYETPRYFVYATGTRLENADESFLSDRDNETT